MSVEINYNSVLIDGVGIETISINQHYNSSVELKASGKTCLCITKMELAVLIKALQIFHDNLED